MVIQQHIRICEQCGNEYVARRLGATPWYRRRFCSRWCAAQPGSRGTPAERFWRFVNKDGPIPDRCPDLGPCWLWTGGTVNGYGHFSWHNSVGLVQVNAHRWSYEALVGPIPAGLEIDHLCMVRACVNPAHLEPVTTAENIRRGIRARTAARTHCRRGHELTPENTKLHARGWRDCRACMRERGARRRARMRSQAVE